MNKSKRVLVIGAGFTGAVMARSLAETGQKVLVIDKRNHIAGNAYDYVCEKTGVIVHKYGAHIFHTPNKEIWDYVNKFATDGFTDYRHRVRASYRGQNYSLPINLDTINHFFGTQMSPAEAKEHIQKEVEESGIVDPKNLEEKAITLIGRSLYEAFIKEYTIKQWKRDPTELPSDIITRLPVRFDYNTRYFNDKYEGMPVAGYTDVVENILNHENIDVILETDFHSPMINSLMDDFIAVYNTSPIDASFDFKHGRLSWRTVDFEMSTHTNIDDHSGTSVTNFNDPGKFTRMIEFKHFYPDRKTNGTVVAFESSREALEHDEAYYPIRTKSDMDILAKYKDEAKTLEETGCFFGGRLGKYKYLDMHQAIGLALSDFTKVNNFLTK